ncbi:hypothetical protein PspKH34_31540 [Parageobacillus sp. KH3-4]|nr:hypothetical protein PspKH34_31540 [Parageobacillus sp. KH3-4]
MIDGVDAVIGRLPKEKDAVVVCAKGGSAAFVAEQLAEEGFNTLAGGMKAWSG